VPLLPTVIIIIAAIIAPDHDDHRLTDESDRPMSLVRGKLKFAGRDYE
jgi:hypothetical protein